MGIFYTVNVMKVKVLLEMFRRKERFVSNLFVKKVFLIIVNSDFCLQCKNILISAVLI